MSLLNENQPSYTEDTGTHHAQPGSELPGTQAVDWEKRYKDLQSYADKKRVEMERQINELRKQSSTFVPPKTKEELEQFKHTNPDHYGAIESIAYTMFEDQINPLREQLTKSQQEAAQAKILQAHPDAFEIANSPEFKAWAEAEGPEIQAWIEETVDASKPIRALSYYKAIANRQQAQNHKPTVDHSAAQAVNVNSGSHIPTGTEGLRAFTRKEIEGMNVAEYEKNYEAIMAAHAAGLITE